MGTSITTRKLRSVAPRPVIRRKPKAPASAKQSGAGVVKFYVQGSASSSAAVKFTPSNLVEVLQVGLPFQELEELQASLAVPTEHLARMLGISKATFHRRKGDAGMLPPAVSDRVVR